MELFNTPYGHITLYKNETYISKAFKSGIYWDINNLLNLKKYIDPNRNILEIGGHCGTSSIIYSSFLNSLNKVFVYEPQKNMYKLLKVNIIQNNLENKIIPYNYAIFCKEMIGNMNNIDLDGGGGLVLKRYNEENNKCCNFGGIGLGKDGEIVNFITIDDNIKHDNIGFIHCDAQGAENFIFSTAKKMIKKNRPVIFFENNSRYKESKYLFDNVCKSYPEYIENSKFNLENYCIKELNYSKIIHNITGSGDDLLIP